MKTRKYREPPPYKVTDSGPVNCEGAPLEFAGSVQP